LVVWHQSDGNINSVRYNRFVDSTRSWSQANDLESNTIRDAILPQVAIDSSGRGIAVWQQNDGQRNNIWLNGFE